MTLSERLQFYRKKSGLSQEEAAASLSVTRQAVSKWETGAAVPDLDTLVRLAALYKVSVTALTREEPQAGELPFDSLRWASGYTPVRPGSIQTLRRLSVAAAVLGALLSALFLWVWLYSGGITISIAAAAVLFFLLGAACRAAGNGLDELFVEFRGQDEDIERRFRLLREQLRKFTNP